MWYIYWNHSIILSDTYEDNEQTNSDVFWFNGSNFWWWDLHYDGDLVLMINDIYLKIFSYFFRSDFYITSEWISTN